MLKFTVLGANMNHKICDSCETVKHCNQHGCVPLKPLTDEEKLALLKKHFNAVCVPEWFDALLLDIEAAHNIKGDA